MFPRPISVPIKTPTICAITAPGPNKGDRIGIAQMTQTIISPPKLLANPFIPLAIRSPTPVSNIKPMTKVTNAIKGIMVLRHRSTASRPAWNNVPTTPPTDLPIRSIKACIMLHLLGVTSTLC